jgi:energy-coupling factor transport system substrate-specific component
MNNVSQSSSITPLRWPVDWDRLSDWQKVLVDMPIVGAQARCAKAILHQLSLRNEDCLAAWSGFSPREIEFSRTISKIVQKHLGWPNDYFIPSDPFEIVIWDRHGDLAVVEVIANIEEIAGSQEWSILQKKPYGEVVSMLAAEHKEKNQFMPSSPSISPSARHRRALLLTVPLGVALDWGLGDLDNALNLPFFLDSVGVIAITLMCGWRFGAIVAVAGSLLSGLLYHSVPYFVFTSFIIAFVVGISAHYGGFKTVPRIIVTGVLLGFICAFVSAPAVSFAFPGPVLTSQSWIAAHWRDTLDYWHHAFASTHFWNEPADKTLQCLGAYILVRALPRNHRHWISSPHGYLDQNRLG